jgi:predicted TIM-barrel fold metal-dependent hydrolase
MNIIDINTMVGPWMFPVRYKDEDGLLSYLDTYHISSAVTYHSGAKLDPYEFNPLMSSIEQRSGGRIRACHVIDPILYTSTTLKKNIAKHRPCAVRMFPKTGRFILDKFYCSHILSVLNESHMPLLLESEEVPDHQVLPVLASQYPNVPIVILRPHFNNSRFIKPLLTKLDNVYFDISIMINTGFLDELVNEVGAGKKLLFGSALPHHVPSGSLGMILYADISDDARNDILHDNWEHLIGGICYDY